MQRQRQIVNLSDFSLLSSIGYGNYAKVILVRRRSTLRVYVMKIVKKKKQQQIKGIKKNHAYIQKQILTECHHPFIVKLYSTFQRQRKLYYILEYCQGGQLFGIIRRQKRLNEDSAKFYTAQILLALQFLHSKGYIYRDLKPQNVLIDAQGYIKLIDFGLSCKINELNNADIIAGTPQYISPEIFDQEQEIKLGFFTDWWAFGVIIFEIIVGFPPFFVQNEEIDKIKNKICCEEPPLHYINNPVLRDLIAKLLNKNPLQRLGNNGIDQIKEHEWFFGTNWNGFLRYQINAPFKPIIKSDCDTQWFEGEHSELTPPEQQIQKSSFSQKYNEFSLSWKSSNKEQNLNQQASPSEIVINIEDTKKMK